MQKKYYKVYKWKMNEREISNVNKELTANDIEFGSGTDGSINTNKLTKHQRQMAWRRRKIF